MRGGTARSNLLTLARMRWIDCLDRRRERPSCDAGVWRVAGVGEAVLGECVGGVDVFGVEVRDDAFGAVGERPSRERADGFAAIAAAAEFRQQAEGEFDIAGVFVGAADERGDADETRRRAFAFVGEQRPAVPALPFGIVREVLFGPLEGSGFERRRRPYWFVRYRDGVEEGGAAGGLQGGQIAIKRKERDALRRQYQHDRSPLVRFGTQEKPRDAPLQS